MPMSSLPAAILSHMTAINNVPPPPLHSIPNLKKSKHINYGQLNALCHIRGQHSRSMSSILSAHNTFMKQYPKVFLHQKPRLPKLFKQEERRELNEDKEESQHQQPDDSHNIAVHVQRAHGGHILYRPKRATEKFEEFLAILKKLPIHRTPCEHKTVWKFLKAIPDLTSQLNDKHLKTLSKTVFSETWLKGSTVVANDGFYVILKGLARPQTNVYKNLIEGSDSPVSFIPQNFHSFIWSEEFKNSTLAEMYLPSYDSMLSKWSTFGTLEVISQIESETQMFSVVTEDDCEILKIPAKGYAKIKEEKIKLENMQKLKLIRMCPYYEEWPTLSIYELIALLKWKKFPPGHVIVESGNIISFVGYINSGCCNIYRSIIGFVKLQSNKVKRSQKLVYMGKLKEKESFGEISVLLQVPFTCTIITEKEVEMAIIEDKDLFELDPVTKQLMLQTAKPTFGHLTDEDVKNEYLKKEQQKEWKDFKDKTVKNSLYYKGIIPGFGKWDHNWSSIPRNLKDTLVNY
ncbi:cyclic nucleotide-binding domain-containing protein 1 isoform X1 [Hylobates moloch]|uniref:cyclic nucleotide-binding domain-containing protein 1 isoform X1 n=2 Tax=Hylobates moloch TaxID=81572 RepID=UPI002674C95A|nr:cyclic nucleotide-binding domain-containing protein 1 isoform X1 [Hylobates moloch]